MDMQRDEDSFYEYSSIIDEDSFSENNKSENILGSLEELDSDPIDHILKINDEVNLSSDLIEKLNGAMTKDKLYMTDHLVFKGHYRSIIKNQPGARIIQDLLSKTSSNVIYEIFEELKLGLAEHYKDTYSNYFMQKLYYFLDPDCLILSHHHCKIKYLEILFKDLVDVSSNRIGTFALQKLMDTFKTDYEFEVMQSYLESMSETELLNMAYVSTTKLLFN